MAKTVYAYCSRCKGLTVPEYRQPTMRRVARLYFILPLPFVPVIPIMASDYIVMLPLCMVYMLGIGPALALVREKGTCGTCGAYVEAKKP